MQRSNNPVKAFTTDLNPPIAGSNWVSGFSVANRCTYFYLPSLKTLFNVGLPTVTYFGEHAMDVSVLCLSDGGANETMSGLFALLEEKIKKKQSLTIVVSEKKREWVLNICKSFVEGSDLALDTTVDKVVSVVGVKHFFGKVMDLSTNLTLKAFPVDDQGRELGFYIVESKKKMKEEFVQAMKKLTPQEKKNFAKDDMFEMVDNVVFTFVRQLDPKSSVFEQVKCIVHGSDTLMIGCTNFQSYLVYEKVEKATDNELTSTLNIESLNYNVLNHFSGKSLWITNVPASISEQGNCDLYCFLLPRIPANQRKKLRVLNYRFENIVEIANPYTIEEIKSIQNERKWVEYPREEVDMENNVYQERVGYFGGGEKKRLKKEALAKKYPNGYNVVYEYDGKYIERTSAFALYEDAYYYFLKEQEELLNWICQHAIDIYDTEPANILSGYDYLIQDKDSATHLQDVAIRRAIKRLGRSFKGKKLIQVRGFRSALFAMNPAYVAFHERSKIQQPEIVEEFMLPGSVESFWQSNKTIVTKK